MKYLLLLLLLLPFNVEAALTDNLVSYWKLDESSGNAADSVSTNTLTNVGTVTYSAQKINNGAVFGTNKYLINTSPTAALQIVGDLTLVGWVSFSSLPPADTNENMLISLRDVDTGRGVYTVILRKVGAALTLQFFHRNTSDESDRLSVAWTPSTSTLYHVAVVVSGTSVYFYVNASQQGTTQTLTQTRVFQSGSDLLLGALHDTGVVYHQGALDEWGVWSRALLSTEVTELYNAGAGLAYPFSVASVATPILGLVRSFWLW